MLKAPLFIRAVIAIRGTTPANRAKNWWTGEDSNLRSPQGAADLQSAGFSHSPTRPAKRFGTQRCHPKSIARSEPDCCTGLLCNAEKARVHRHQPQRFCREESVRIPTTLIPVPQKISWRRELNPRPSDYKSDALPAELRQPCSNRAKLSHRQSNCKQGFPGQQNQCQQRIYPLLLKHGNVLLYSRLGKFAILECDVVMDLIHPHCKARA